jgi:hypothetical protein
LRALGLANVQLHAVPCEFQGALRVRSLARSSSIPLTGMSCIHFSRTLSHHSFFNSVYKVYRRVSYALFYSSDGELKPAPLSCSNLWCPLQLLPNVGNF